MKVITFFRLSWRQKLGFLINFMLCGLARFSIKLFHYSYLQPYFGYAHPMKVASTIIPKAQYRRVWAIKRSIELAARYTPWDSSCLTQAMVAKFWCQIYNIPYFFFIGFAKQSPKPLGQDAHAWVTAGPIAITGGHSLNTHQVIYCFSNLK